MKEIDIVQIETKKITNKMPKITYKRALSEYLND